MTRPRCLHSTALHVGDRAQPGVLLCRRRGGCPQRLAGPVELHASSQRMIWSPTYCETCICTHSSTLNAGGLYCAGQGWSGRQARLQQASQHRPGLALMHLLRQKQARKQEGLARQLCHLKLEWLMHLSHYQVFCGRASRVCRTLQASLQLSLPHCLRPSRSAAPSLLCCC